MIYPGRCFSPAGEGKSADQRYESLRGRAGPRRGPVDAIQAGLSGDGLSVPKTPSTSCDLGVLVNDAAETVAPPDLELI
jgi:hypothetical protein